MYVAKAAAVFAAALFCLASPAAATTAKNGTATKHTFAGKNALNQKLKAAGVGRGSLFPKGEVFSFYIDYADELEVYYPNPPDPAKLFRAAFYEKAVFADDAKTKKIGNALYNIQLFDMSTIKAEGNYQSVQNIPLTDKRGNDKDVYININGRIEYTLNPAIAAGYPTAVTQAKILSIAVSSLEADGISCVNVGVNPIQVSGKTVTEYIIDARKAVCVPQVKSA